MLKNYLLKGIYKIIKFKIQNSSKKGFTLVEIIIVMAIFSILMGSATAVFSKYFKSYQSARALQQDLEEAQFAMNLLAKNLRTSTVQDPTLSSTVSQIIAYNNSTGKCNLYKITSDAPLFCGEDAPADPNNLTCSTTESDYTSDDCTVGNISAGNFYVVPSATGVAGKVTISLEVAEGNDKARIQSTVSLRDYSVQQ